jgi:hypothetical protein
MPGGSVKGIKLSTFNIQLLTASSTHSPATSHSASPHPPSSTANSPPPSPCTVLTESSDISPLPSQPLSPFHEVSPLRPQELKLGYKLDAPDNLKVPYPQKHDKDDPVKSDLERTAFTEKCRTEASNAFIPEDLENLKEYVRWPIFYLIVLIGDQVKTMYNAGGVRFDDKTYFRLIRDIIQGYVRLHASNSFNQEYSDQTLVKDVDDKLIALIISDMPEHMKTALRHHVSAALGVKPDADIVYQDSAASREPTGQTFTAYHFDIYGRCYTGVCLALILST